MIKNQFPNFKPKFGSESHLRILNLIKKYYSVRDEYEEVLRSRKKSPELLRECRKMKQRIRWLIANDDTKTA